MNKRVVDNKVYLFQCNVVVTEMYCMQVEDSNDVIAYINRVDWMHIVNGCGTFNIEILNFVRLS